MAFSAHAHWLLGHDDEALAACRQAITLARAIDHPYSQAVALAYACITHQMRRDLPELRNMVDELRRLCDRYDFAYYREWALILDGWSRDWRFRRRPGPPRHRQPQIGGRVRAHAVLAVAARRSLSPGQPARRRAGHP